MSVRRSGFPAGAARLYADSLPATRGGALYNAFSYPTKIAPESIALFIATHTAPGETVLDVFAGSGTTGLAAKLCDRPTPAMVEMAEAMGVKPKWGPRRAVLYDVSVLGSFVSSVMCNAPDARRFRIAAEALVRDAEESHGWLYETTDADGVAGTVRHIIWSDVLLCPHCGREVTYWDAAVRYEPLRLQRAFQCKGCRKKVAIDACERAVDVVKDHLLDRQIERKRRVPVYVYGRSGSTNWRRAATDSDLALAKRAEETGLPATAPRHEIAWGDLYRAGYHRGITHLHHFYTPRNFLALCTLWDRIDQFDEDVRDALRLLVLSFNASHSTLMTRVVVKQQQRDFVLTGAQSGVLYVSGLPVEKNVFDGVRRKIGTFTEAFELVAGSNSEVEVRNASSTSINLPSESVRYVFTDPPFGDYIPYAEINQLNEAWLGSLTDRESEIIVSAAAGKDVGDYGTMMRAVFKEAARVLEPDGLATVVFHSAKASVWRALIDAYADAGLGVRTTSILEKTQPSFKQVVSSTIVKGDPLILLRKSPSRQPAQRPTSVDDVVEAVIADSKMSAQPTERTRERLFSRFVTRCLAEGIPVSLGAAEFYALPEVARAT